MNNEIKLNIKNIIWKVLNYHKPGNKKDIVIFTTRRSGSTWITNIINSERGIKYLDQPLDLRLADRTQKKLLPHDRYSKFVYLNTTKEKQKVFKYFELIFDGELKVRNPWNVFDDDYNFKTNRQVLKLCNGKALIEDFIELFNIEVLFFIRHPIPQSLSVMKRNWGYSPVYAFLENELFVKKYLNEDKLKFIESVLDSGSLLEKHVLNWVLQNLIPLKSNYKNKWLTLSYEELVLKPREIINFLAERLQLDNKEGMYEKIDEPSKTTKSEKNKIASSKENRVNYLIHKWYEECSEEEKKNINIILDKFEIKCYNANEILPTDGYLLLN